MFNLGSRFGQGRVTDTLGNFYDGNFEKGLPQGVGIQRKGAEISISSQNGNTSNFTVPNSKKEVNQFIQRVVSMI